jgi:hypothetical protein
MEIFSIDGVLNSIRHSSLSSVMSPEICPICGAEVPPNAKACPECGADEKTGWSDEAGAGGLDLPDENFNYGEFVKREFGGGKKNLIPRGIHWFWWMIAVLILAVSLLVLLH